MDFKIDENLPLELAQLLRGAGYDAMTVTEQRLGGAPDADVASVCQHENRTLITLDVDFADIRAYPPSSYPGLVVLRLKQHDKSHILGVMSHLINVFATNTLEHRLWIVDEQKIRVRE
jgi:predicted nuclease of predicted toxin-antitoxin system